MTNRAYMAETGAIPLLVSLLTSQDPKSLRKSCNCAPKFIYYAIWCIQPITNVLRNKCSIDAVFFNFSSFGGYKKSIGKRPDVIPPLINLLWDIIVKGKRDAATALFNL